MYLPHVTICKRTSGNVETAMDKKAAILNVGSVLMPGKLKVSVVAAP